MSKTMIPDARWNGEPATARRVRVIVGESERPTWWCAGLAGTERFAVEVKYEGQTFYLDDEDGSGTAKVTTGRGSPWASHSSLPVARVLGEMTGDARHVFAERGSRYILRCIGCDVSSLDPLASEPCPTPAEMVDS